jgi:hypothetical protein
MTDLITGFEIWVQPAQGELITLSVLQSVRDIPIYKFLLSVLS